MSGRTEHMLKEVLTGIPDGIPPSAADGSTNGTGIDRLPDGLQGFDAVILNVASGVATGSPSPQTLNVKLQESSDDGSSDAYADIADAAIVEQAADDTEESVEINLKSAKKWIRVVEACVLTGGSSPKWPRSVTLTKVGYHQTPAS